MNDRAYLPYLICVVAPCDEPSQLPYRWPSDRPWELPPDRPRKIRTYTRDDAIAARKRANKRHHRRKLAKLQLKLMKKRGKC